ncbi:hypothetical protein L211DRAFT_833365 [Terfezia boudieri ATCC MYA-4762]|uniref:Uncharacterized protein n=1 Tax=Terfezia boudieri ATCC MYA-4762 TaxID=1051890 RepID=A0A3N4M5Q4_9PEZI|nr:hypothetical protein L211DRAFT_833365 [Terfezia boudieri ATCC MYA-4762]
MQWVDPKSQGMDTGHHFLTISRLNLSKPPPLILQERGTELPSEPPFIRNSRLCKEYSIDSVSRKPRRYFSAQHRQCNGNMPACPSLPPNVRKFLY